MAWLDEQHAVALAYSANNTGALIEVDTATGLHRVLHRPSQLTVDSRYLSVPQTILFPSPSGPISNGGVHAWFYPPTHPTQRGPEGSKPPLIVTIHGGPTSVSKATLNLSRQFTNLFGISDMAALAATSHKFESQYDVSLIGKPHPELYRPRSPIYHLDGFQEPLLTLQGSEDKIVPPSQSQKIVAALEERGVPHAYIEFAGEQHGFRQAASIIRSQEAELSFYSQTFGFVPADEIEAVTIRHWPRK